MTKTIDQLSTLTDAATDDVLLLRDTSTGDDKQISVADSRFTQYGQSESVTLSSNVLTIPYGQSTVKLPSSVWDGTANLVIQQIQFSGGAQPAEGYEFALIVPRSSQSLTAGTLGNEVLFQDGTLLKTNAYLNQDFPCYPDAADNPDTDPVSLAAPYYRLIFRVDGYSGSDPIIVLDKLPNPVSGSNDRGDWVREPYGWQTCYVSGLASATVQRASGVYRSSIGSDEQATINLPLAPVSESRVGTSVDGNADRWTNALENPLGVLQVALFDCEQSITNQDVRAQAESRWY